MRNISTDRFPCHDWSETGPLCPRNGPEIECCFEITKRILTSIAIHLPTPAALSNVMPSMTFLFMFGTYIMGFVFFTYVCVIADPDDSRLAHLLTIRLPDQLASQFTNLVGPKYAGYCFTASDYLLVLLYVVVVGGSWGIIFTFVYPWIEDSSMVFNYHKYVGVVVFALCVLSWRHASTVSPGIITAGNIAKFDNYPYDNIMYVEGRICPTVGIRKLARSKFDRFSQVHIARFDHFCGWLHNPIGEENYRWFLLFLAIHVGMCTYGFIICGYLFLGEIEKQRLWEATFFSNTNDAQIEPSPWIIFQFLFYRHQMVGSVFVLMGAMVITLGVFFGYHLWIASRGMSTNETAKWSEVKKWHKRETDRYKAAVKAGVREVTTVSTPSVSDGDVTCTGSQVVPPENALGTTEAEIVNPGPMPHFIYNLGFTENWRDVLYPRSLRTTALERYKASLVDNPELQTVSTDSLSTKLKRN